MASTKTRTYLPYAEMDCPVKGCKSLNGGPQHGKVPGVKRHVRLVHGDAAYKKVKSWPALHPEGASPVPVGPGRKASAKSARKSPAKAKSPAKRATKKSTAKAKSPRKSTARKRSAASKEAAA